MSKYEKGQKLIIERKIAISVHEMNGKPLPLDVNIIEYPKGEVFEILQVLDGNNYLIEFWADSNETYNGKSITYSFDEETIDSWLKKEDEEEVA